MATYQKLRGLISQMKHSNPEVRYNALAELHHLDLDEIDQDSMNLILKEAASVFPDPVDSWDEPSYVLIEFLTRYQSEFIFKNVDKYISGYSALAKSEYLNYLLKLNKEEHFKKFTILFKQFATVENLDIDTDLLSYNLDFCSIFIPETLSLLHNDHYSYMLLAFLYQALENEKMQTIEKEWMTSFILSHFFRWLREYQPYDEAYDLRLVYRFWKENYFNIRGEILICLYLMKFYFNDEIETILYEVLDLKDKRLKSIAIGSLLRHNKPVTKNDVFDCAKSLDTRTIIYDILKLEKRLDLYPQEFLSQESFVESIVFLALLRSKDTMIAEEIRVLKPILQKNQLGEEVNFYPFMFKSNEEEWIEKGYMIGVNGGFEVKSLPTTQCDIVLTHYQSTNESKMNFQIKELLRLFTNHEEGEANEVLATMLPQWGRVTSFFFALSLIQIVKVFLKGDPTMIIIPLPFFLYFGYMFIQNIRARKTHHVMLKTLFIEYGSNDRLYKVSARNIKYCSIIKRKFSDDDYKMFHLSKGDHIVFFNEKDEELLSIPLQFVNMTQINQYLEMHEIEVKK